MKQLTVFFKIWYEYYVTGELYDFITLQFPIFGHNNTAVAQTCEVTAIMTSRILEIMYGNRALKNVQLLTE
jgi:hypothetical protein